MTTTLTLSGAILLGIAISYTVASIVNKDEGKCRVNSLSADIYFAAFILLIGLYSTNQKVINVLPTQKDTVIKIDTFINHAPDGNTVIPAYNPRANEAKR